MPELNYLQDDEIELTPEKDLLGSLIYVDQLVEMIKYTMETKQVESIALFGDWGSGKSSIVKSLKQQLEKNEKDSNIRIFTYNAWLYNNDSFRKNFIASIIDDEKEKEKYLRKVYTSETETTIKLNDQIKKYWWILLIGIVVIPSIFWILELNIKEFDISKIIDAILKMFALGIFAYVADFIFKKVAVETQITTHKEYSPYDFVNDFEWVQEKKKYYSVYLIDDIDRCSPAQILEILETIKGLLKTINNKNYLFLIPLDRDRIISILKNERNYSYADSLDYFSKIFDLSLNMKKSGNINLFEMAKKKSEEIGLNISNRSLSILTDFVFTTPRSVKNTLNSLMIISQLLKKQVAKHLILDDINESLFDEFVLIYVLETKWKEFFDYLTINKDSSRLNLTKQLDAFELENKKDTELKKFIGRLSITRLKYLDSYISLKNDNTAIDGTLFDKIIGRTSFRELEQQDYDNEKFIPTLEHFYKIYLVERTLYSDYLINFIYVYFEYFETDNNERLDKILASKIDFNTIIRYLSSQQSNKEFADKFVDGVAEKIKKIKTNHWPNEINRFCLVYLTLLSNSTHINKMISFAKTEVFDKINCDHHDKEEFVLNLITKDKDDSDFEKIIDKFKTNNDSLEEILKVAIEGKRVDIVAIVTLINDELLVNNENSVIEILSFKEQLAELSNLDTMMKQKRFKYELDILCLGLKKKLEDVLSYIDTTRISSYCDSYLNQLFNVEDTLQENLIEKYIEFVALYDENKYGDLQLVSKLIVVLSQLKKDKYILNLIKFYKKDYANELFILAISIGNGTIVKDYINFIKEHTEVNLELWISLTNHKKNVSYIYKFINYQNSIIDYNFFKKYILLDLFNLSKNISTELIANYTFKEIFAIASFDEFILKLKRSDERRLVLIDMIEDMDDYIDCLKIANKNSNKVKYHDAFRRIINNNISVDRLKDIHDKYASGNNILDKTELNIMKDKVLESFPQYQEDFNYVSFKSK